MNRTIETEEDIQIIKEFTLLPILLDMLARDIRELELYRDKIVYYHAVAYLKEIEQSVYAELHTLKNKMRKNNIKILTTETSTLGIDVEYKVRGYIHHFKMLRSLIKAELMTMLTKLRGRLK
ncbi:hypothetical protein ACFQ88_09500 [Paenibacillus sp. NPDC056579]|uniref:hypothetical protein n=1 Tax=unclassified Paenibacillus TaxID=185978 RepID=UPI001EF7C7A0|nr:hypothetical protein [Paenibacillus sp. H1-7]